jgi:predicted ferric reductase
VARAALGGLLAANVLAIVVLWLRAGGVTDAHGSAAVLTSVGRLTALLGAYLALVVVLLLARVPALERLVGFGSLVAWHRHAGRWCLAFLLAHAVLTTGGLMVGDRISLWAEARRLISEYPGVITATAGLLLLVAVALTSAVAIRRRLRYEAWYAVHLYTYLAIALAFSHQIATGKDFVGAPAARAYWIALYVVTLGAVVMCRLARPVALALRHRLRVERVIEEAPGVVSIEIGGRHLERLRARSGQFFLWRFLTRDRWWQAHPFSLSAAPNERRLRITVGAAGDFTAAVGELAPGTRVVAEGPFGVFTTSAMSRRRVVLIAGGMGITPIRALLENMTGDIELVYRSRDADAIALREEIDAIAAARGVRVHYVGGTGGRGGGGGAAGEGGGDLNLSAALLTELVPDIAQRDAFVCGPPAMVEAAFASLEAAGADTRHIVTERFGL